MKHLLVIALLTFAVGLATSQVSQNYKFFVPLVNSETDTIPGTETGGPGAGGTGWLNVGDNDVVYSVTSVDSTYYTTIVDYADTGYSAATGSSAKDVGYKSYVTTVTTDSVAIPVNSANPKTLISRVIREKGYVDNIPGGRWIRIRIIAQSSKNAGAVADRTVRVNIRTFRYAGN